MQIDIPFFAYILRDTYTLSNYDSGKVTPLSEIRKPEQNWLMPR